ncbi:hypothetical protein J6590_011878 [Homalodisca vitripennis]|nr:hypothetical protein J6590_011878 [Homalodisca vitripennis]
MRKECITAGPHRGRNALIQHKSGCSPRRVGLLCWTRTRSICRAAISCVIARRAVASSRQREECPYSAQEWLQSEACRTTLLDKDLIDLQSGN